MRKFFTPGEANSCSGQSAENRPGHSLTVAHCNKNIATSGRTTSTYIVSNDIIDAAPEPVSFFLLPDPYAGHSSADEYYTHPDDYSCDEYPVEEET